jgi:cysteinyl-tRNA synthetase
MDWLRRIFHIGPSEQEMPLYFFNSLGRSRQVFQLPKNAHHVRMYNCGPTVYDKQHIGNLSAAVFADTIRRVLEYNNFSVKQVINITDFGHLVSDADEGEDKMTKGMKREKMTLTMEHMREFGTKYMKLYLEDISALNVATEKIQFPRASDYVPAMIAMIKTLEEKGYAYKISDGVYFDTQKFPAYGALGGISDSQQEGSRVAANAEKRSAHDFVLWKSVGSRSKIGWDSPWGKGFPGWHLECSAMIHSILGTQIDIHTGGIEHQPIHHNNEIAQSEAATGKKPLSRFWMHREHIRMDNAKLAKSTGNTAYLSDVVEHGIHPYALRYWFLTAHYRQAANFTWEALEGAQKAYLRLYQKYQEVKDKSDESLPSRFKNKFVERINDDLDTPGAIAALWENLNADTFSDGEIKTMLSLADSVLGLGFMHSDEQLKNLVAPQQQVSTDALSEDVKKLFDEREEARASKDWARADKLRSDIADSGYTIEDTPTGAKLLKK